MRGADNNKKYQFSTQSRHNNRCAKSALFGRVLGKSVRVRSESICRREQHQSIGVHAVRCGSANMHWNAVRATRNQINDHKNAKKI